MYARRTLLLAALAATTALAACTDDAPRTAAARATATTTGATAADPAGRPITDEEIARITSRDDFVDASDIIAEQGGEIDLAGGLVYSYDTLRGTESRFTVARRDGDPSVPLDDLVFQDIDQTPALFYFLSLAAGADPKAAASHGDGATTAGLFGCGSWSSWSFTGTYCGNHFWCFGKAQKGTYATFQRSRQCKHGIQVSNRTDFVGCGC
jgi:hypothetical protein